MNTRRVFLALDAVQKIADLEAAASEEDKSHTKALLARESAMIMKPEHERVLRLEAPQAALARAADQGMPLRSYGS